MSRSSGSASLRKLAHYYTQLATLLNAGLTLGQTFNALANQSRGHLGEFSRSAARMAAEGRSVAEIFRSHEALFGTPAVQRIAAGETAGRLPDVFAALAAQCDERRRFRSTIISGLVYPVILAHVAILLITLVRVVMEKGGVAAFALRAGLLFAASYGVVGALYGLWRLTRTVSALGSALDAAIALTPYAGSLVRRASTARFCRSYADLLEAGLPVERALDEAARAAGNFVLQRAIEPAREGVRRGLPLSEALPTRRPFTPYFYDLLQTGERTGAVPQMLRRVAEVAEAEFATSLKRLSVVLPLLFYLGVIAAIAWFVVSWWLQYFGEALRAGG